MSIEFCSVVSKTFDLKYFWKNFALNGTTHEETLPRSKTMHLAFQKHELEFSSAFWLPFLSLGFLNHFFSDSPTVFIWYNFVPYKFAFLLISFQPEHWQLQLHRREQGQGIGRRTQPRRREGCRGGIPRGTMEEGCMEHVFQRTDRSPRCQNRSTGGQPRHGSPVS